MSWCGRETMLQQRTVVEVEPVQPRDDVAGWRTMLSKMSVNVVVLEELK
jgi:hypothetical protein